MAAINHFEEILAWKEARLMTRTIYEITQIDTVSKDFGLKDQIRRASVSVMSNIAEGYGYNSDKQFARFLDISRASACEVQSLLYVALDAQLIGDETFEEIFGIARKTISMIAALQRTLKA